MATGHPGVARRGRTLIRSLRSSRHHAGRESAAAGLRGRLAGGRSRLAGARGGLAGARSRGVAGATAEQAAQQVQLEGEQAAQQAEGATGNVLDFLGGELANSHFETS